MLRKWSYPCGNDRSHVILSSLIWVRPIGLCHFFPNLAMQTCIAPYFFEISPAGLHGSIFFQDSLMQACIVPYFFEISPAGLQGPIFFANPFMQACIAPYFFEINPAGLQGSIFFANPFLQILYPFTYSQLSLPCLGRLNGIWRGGRKVLECLRSSWNAMKQGEMLADAWLRYSYCWH